jgi:SNF2 family DNA or RNA helicase
MVRLRRADEHQRYASSQRQGRIDPNPHQIDAVIFALKRIPEGGCILADEVGLGKTIEAGLVIAQLRAEGAASRVLLVVPKPLLGQWQDELYRLFGIQAVEGRIEPGGFNGHGVFLVGREFAGSERGAGILRESEPFDLCVIDEAHEVFANIYRRFDKDGNYNPDSSEARTADRVRSFLGKTPALLLTATPIQNNLTELWGLVQYVEPTGTLLGSLRTFRDVFCDGDDRVLVPGQDHELRGRTETVVQRTLRRQAQEFLDRPFVARHAQIFEYTMTPEEKSLYDDVTAYLLEPQLFAVPGKPAAVATHWFSPTHGVVGCRSPKLHATTFQPDVTMLHPHPLSRRLRFVAWECC